jgi:hypothetical protein
MVKDKAWASKGKHYADDRIHTLDELRKLVLYPDRRMKAIVFTQLHQEYVWVHGTISNGGISSQ